jgi:hypothetical protein
LTISGIDDVAFCCRGPSIAFGLEVAILPSAVHQPETPYQEMTHAIRSHRGCDGDGNAVRPSRQPSGSTSVVRGHEQGRGDIFLQLHHPDL